MTASAAMRAFGLVVVVAVGVGALSGCSARGSTTPPGSADASPAAASLDVTPTGVPSAAAAASASPAASPVELLKAWALDVSDGRLWAAAMYFADTPDVSIGGATHRPPNEQAVVEMLRSFPCGFDVLSTVVEGDQVTAYATGNASIDRADCNPPLPYSLVARFDDGLIESLAIDVVMPPHQ